MKEGKKMREGKKKGRQEGTFRVCRVRRSHMRTVWSELDKERKGKDKEGRQGSRKAERQKGRQKGG